MLVVCKSDSVVFAVICGTESLTVQYICSLESLLGLVQHNPQDSAFVGVEFHLLYFIPLFKGREVILEFLVVSLVVFLKGR